MTNGERIVKVCEEYERVAASKDLTVFFDMLKQELDAAERRGWIAALEWARSRGYGQHEDESELYAKLAELKAEENK